MNLNFLMRTMMKKMREIIYLFFIDPRDACNPFVQYYIRNMKSICKHFSNKYCGLKISENNQKCMIQISFKTKLYKIILYEKYYIQQYYERIINENIIIRRLLISIEYIHEYLSI